ncbi:MAG: HAD-IIIA family hydrolase [Bacteroidales bacterium]|nr:HAD-IIIA family hydrolase [Bacteroidales bacterium]
MDKAVFLDRDGVINDGSAYYTYSPEQFIFNKDIAVALKLLQENLFKLIIITNQSGIAKGVYTTQDVEKTHNYMKSELQKYGVVISGIYFCPHHPEVSICNCRKPQNGLLLEAIAQT